MTTKPTALPEHEPHHKFMKVYTQQQLIDYGRAEYLRGLEDAAKVCEEGNLGTNYACAEAIREFKEQPNA